MKKSLKRTLSIGGVVVVLALLLLPKFGWFSKKETESSALMGAGSGLPVSGVVVQPTAMENVLKAAGTLVASERSEEHTSELQSRPHLVCRLLLEKKKKTQNNQVTTKSNTQTHQAHNPARTQ